MRDELKEQLIASERYGNSEPVVLVTGGGQARLPLATTLGRLRVDTLVVDRHEGVGVDRRKGYQSLALHNSTEDGISVAAISWQARTRFPILKRSLQLLSDRMMELDRN